MCRGSKQRALGAYIQSSSYGSFAEGTYLIIIVFLVHQRLYTGNRFSHLTNERLSWLAQNDQRKPEEDRSDVGHTSALLQATDSVFQTNWECYSYHSCSNSFWTVFHAILIKVPIKVLLVIEKNIYVQWEWVNVNRRTLTFASPDFFTCTLYFDLAFLWGSLHFICRCKVIFEI